MHLPNPQLLTAMRRVPEPFLPLPDTKGTPPAPAPRAPRLTALRGALSRLLALGSGRPARPQPLAAPLPIR